MKKGKPRIFVVAGGSFLLFACGGGERNPPTEPSAAMPPAASVAADASSGPVPSPAGVVPLSSAAPAPDSPPAAPVPQAPPVSSYDRLGSAARIAEIRALVDATAAVVVSPAFHTHLAALTTLRATPDSSPTLAGEDVYRSYVGFDAISKPGPTSYAPKEASCLHQTAITDFKGTSGSTTFLNRCTFNRAASRPVPGSDDVEAFACAINTIAHEWTHTISEVGNPAKERYLDRGRNPSSGMLVSYTVGAVAQCTYLEAGDHLPVPFDACIDAAGTNLLKTAPCAKGWAKKHSARPN